MEKKKPAKLGGRSGRRQEVLIDNLLNHNGSDLASIAEALGAKKVGNRYMARCPLHGDNTPSLSLNAGRDGQLLVYCFAGCDRHALLDEIRRIMGGGRIVCQPQRYEDEAEKKRRAAWAIEKVWSETRDVQPGDPVHKYLTETRRLPLEHIPADLRFHPRLGYYEGSPEPVGHYPAMVAAIRDIEGRLTSLHRTYLTDDGRKLEGREPRKIMTSASTIKGAAIRLGKITDGRLLVAEGIETAIAAGILSELPAWATCTAGGLEAVEIPPGVTVTIAQDNDRAGRKAALALAYRLGGAVIADAGKVLGREKADWLDVLSGEVA